MGTDRLLATSLLLLAALFAGAVRAADAPPGAKPPGATSPDAPAGLVAFGTVDLNHDGVISTLEAEAMPDLHGEFEQLDSNRDGQLSPREYERWRRGAKVDQPSDPGAAPGGSSGAQHVPPTGG